MICSVLDTNLTPDVLTVGSEVTATVRYPKASEPDFIRAIGCSQLTDTTGRSAFRTIEITGNVIRKLAPNTSVVKAEMRRKYGGTMEDAEIVIHLSKLPSGTYKASAMSVSTWDGLGTK